MQQDRENGKYLPELLCPKTFTLERDLADAVRMASALMVVPSHGYRSVFTRLPHLQEETLLVSAVKGIENSTLQTMTQVMQLKWHGQQDCTTMFISGFNRSKFCQ